MEVVRRRALSNRRKVCVGIYRRLRGVLVLIDLQPSVSAFHKKKKVWMYVHK